ncbi:MAG: hypothetical protein ACK41T_08790 [Pseudobdellovibrio sp.]
MQNHKSSFIYRYIVAILLALSATSCKKRDPNPELSDPVYKQLLADLGVATAEHSSNLSLIEKIKSDLSKSKPQTGQNKVFEKQLNEAQNNSLYTAQMVRLYEVKIEQRKLEVQKRYLESLLENGRKWPDQEDIDKKEEELIMLRSKISRVKKKEDVPRGTPSKTEQKSEH